MKLDIYENYEIMYLGKRKMDLVKVEDEKIEDFCYERARFKELKYVLYGTFFIVIKDYIKKGNL